MYKALNNKDKIYKSTGGLNMVMSKATEYSIYWVKSGHILHILDIKDHFINPKGIAEGIAKMMNQDKIILDLK